MGRPPDERFGPLQVWGSGRKSSPLQVVAAVILVVAALGLLFPYLPVGVRRLHDTGKSGWYWLIALIPFLGWLLLIVEWASVGETGSNQFGDPPPGGEPASRPPPSSLPPPPTP
jgi:uncharacterized membrane protein YhaH (DUF805 family)